MTKPSPFVHDIFLSSFSAKDVSSNFTVLPNLMIMNCDLSQPYLDPGFSGDSFNSSDSWRETAKRYAETEQAQCETENSIVQDSPPNSDQYSTPSCSRNMETAVAVSNSTLEEVLRQENANGNGRYSFSNEQQKDFQNELLY